MNFYKKEIDDTISVLDLITNKTKLQMNWDMISKGANVTEVFKMNPVSLDTFLQGDIKLGTSNNTAYLDDYDEEGY